MSEYINKVDQLDAYLIDTQSKELLKQSLMKVFPQKIVLNNTLEIQLLLDFLFFRFTTSKGIQTPGNSLQNLKYKFKSNRQMMSLIALQILIPYLFEKIYEKILKYEWYDSKNQRRDAKLIQKLKYMIAFLFRFAAKLQQVSSLVNFLGFMSGGKIAKSTLTGRTNAKDPYYRAMRNLSETLLQVKLGKQDESLSQRNMSFEYVNILVVWTALGKSMANLLPFVDFSRVKKLISGGTMQFTQTFTFGTEEVEGASSNEQTGMLCMVCGTTQIVMPYRAEPCKCVYCYFCIQSKMQEAQNKDIEDEAAKQVKCLKCGKLVDSIEKYDLS